MSLRSQIEGWRDEALTATRRETLGTQVWSVWKARLEAYNRVLASLDGCIVLKEEDVRAETAASAYLRGSRAYAELGGGMIRLDTMEGLQDGELLRVLVLRGESDES